MDSKSTSELKSTSKSTHKLGFFGFFAITASMVMTVYEYPSFATSGFQLVLKWLQLKAGSQAVFILGLEIH